MKTLVVLTLTAAIATAPSALSWAAPAGPSAPGSPVRLTLPRAEFNQRMGRLPVNSPARRGRGFCRTMSEAEWNLVFPETPSEYGGTVCVRG